MFPDPVLRGRDDVAQLLFERDAAGGGLRLAQCTAYRGRQSLEVGLEHVVDGAALQGIDGALLADRAREEDERNVRRELLRHFEGREAVETGQGEIGQDDVRADRLAAPPRRPDSESTRDHWHENPPASRWRTAISASIGMSSTRIT